MMAVLSKVNMQLLFGAKVFETGRFTGCWSFLFEEDESDPYLSDVP
jgi:hypothetical protein